MNNPERKCDDSKVCNKENVNPKYSELDREEIVRRRKERDKAKQNERKLRREQQELKRKLHRKSDKIKLITTEEKEKYEKPTPVQKTHKIKARKANPSFNLLEYIIEREKQSKPLKKVGPSLPKKLKKGKTRERPKTKRYSLLKRTILRNRELKKNRVPNDEHNKENTESPLDNILVELESLSISEIKPHSIHSRTFRSYCDNLTSKELCKLSEKLLKELFRFQKRAYEKNEIKARAHRRYVVGFKEVQRQLDVMKLRLVFIAPDCEQCDLPGGIDEIVQTIKVKCNNQDVPYIFSLRKHRLGYVLIKKVPVSCVGIISFDGAQDIFHELIKCLQIERENYEKTIKL